MITFNEFVAAGNSGDSIGLRLKTPSGNLEELAITTSCLPKVISGALQACSALPPKTQIEATEMKGELSFAVRENFQPALVMSFGPVSLSIPLSEPQAASLQDDIQKFLEHMKRKQ